MFLIFSGVIEIDTKMDNGTNMIIERCSRGTIINATNFLLEENLHLRASNTMPAYIYVIDKIRFLSIIVKDKILLDHITKHVEIRV